MYQKQEVRLEDGNVQVLETARESVEDETASNGKDMYWGRMKITRISI